MKKLYALLIAAGMVVASAAPASAVDVKVDGQHQFTFDTTSTGFNGENTELAKQRLRLGLSMAASENLSGYVQFQLLHNRMMGQSDGAHGDNDTTVRQMYIDWTVPGTAAKVRMGRQLLGLPADAFGCNGVMDAGWGSRDGVVVTSPVTDWLSLTALWVRAGYAAADDATHDLDRNASNDVYAAVADMKFDGVNVAVYGAFATIDDSFTAADITKQKDGFAGSDGLPMDAGQAYWLGATSTLSFFDPFTLKLSAAFGEYAADADGIAGGHGWNVQAKASYAMGFGTPVLGAWYFSGDDKEKGDGTMPSVGGYFTPTRTLHDAAFALGGGQCWYLPSGNWGVQVGIEGVSFLKDLSHDFLISYMQGTNDKDLASDKAVYMTEEDSLVSFDFINTYQIYKNLTACLEISYIISDYEQNIGTDTENPRGDNFTEDDWRVALNFQYKF